jgi:predicted MFS family arabinose efflux permease
MAIIADTFVSEDSRSTMMGIFTSSATVVAALLGFASGIVAAYGWRLVYRIYLLSLPILFMVFLFLPQDKATSDTTEESSSANEKMPWGRLLFMAVALLIFNIVYCIVYYQVSMIITEKEIGDTRVIGAAASSGAIGGIIGAAILGLVYPRLKRFTTLICYGGMTISFFLLIIASRASLAIVACALIGISYSLGTAYYMMYCTTFVPPGKVPLSISITTTAMSVGQFLSTYCATALQGILNTSTLTAVLPVLAAAVGAGVVISLVTTLVDRKKDSEAKTQPSLKQ